MPVIDDLSATAPQPVRDMEEQTPEVAAVPSLVTILSGLAVHATAASVRGISSAGTPPGDNFLHCSCYDGT